MRFSKVFGIGLPKTGTTTLSTMFKELDLNHAPYDLNLIHSIAKGSISGTHEFIERYDSFEDWPWPVLWHELVKRYPDAGFILTVRSTDRTWLNSLQKHTDRNPSLESTALRKKFFGAVDPWTEDAVFLEHYKRHNNAIRDLLGSSPNFLEACWEHGDGWDCVTEFLGVDSVSKTVPHSNKKPDPVSLILRRTKKIIKSARRKT